MAQTLYDSVFPILYQIAMFLCVSSAHLWFLIRNSITQDVAKPCTSLRLSIAVCMESNSSCAAAMSF